ncbi:MAG: aminotransferase class I/II-fold pyridoxal phosphate-dependent enzyme [Rhizomicrobium sp.]
MRPLFLEIATPEDNLFVVNSFSKPWAMTGWRIGWLIHPVTLDAQMKVIAIANNTGPTSFAQYGALAALSPEGDAFRAEMLERCRKGRDVVQNFIDGQNRIRWMKPEGAFYGFLKIDGHDRQPCLRRRPRPPRMSVSRRDRHSRRMTRKWIPMCASALRRIRSCWPKVSTELRQPSSSSDRSKLHKLVMARECGP